jgi:hypothetical protein
MTAKEKRLLVHKKCNGHCGYCGREILFKEMQVDHIEPQYKKVDPLHFGVTIDIDSLENLMPTCRRCNHYKRASDLEWFRKRMKTLHERLGKHYINKVAVDFGMINILPFDGMFYFEKLNSEQSAQVSDTTDDDSSNAAGNKKTFISESSNYFIHPKDRKRL